MNRRNLNVAIPKQPHWLISYWEAGKLLHVSVILFVMESYLYGSLLLWSIKNEWTFWIFLWFTFSLFSFAHIFLVIADGWSRYQDYKRAKDQLFTYGCNPRILNQFATSQCQRSACIRAAKELGYHKETVQHYNDLGYRWYHLLPDFMVNDPFFFYKKYFWRRTFLEKYYKPKYDFRQISMTLQVQ